MALKRANGYVISWHDLPPTCGFMFMRQGTVNTHGSKLVYLPQLCCDGCQTFMNPFFSAMFPGFAFITNMTLEGNLRINLKLHTAFTRRW